MDPQRALSREQSRRVDQIAVEHYGIPSIVLMENAGRGAVDVLRRIDPMLDGQRDDPLVAIVCGKGNNAGDGFVVARHLAIHGVAAKVLLLGPPDKLSGDALVNYRILTHANIPLIDLSAKLAVADERDGALSLIQMHLADAAWLVDAMLGTGAVGQPRAPFDTAIESMNAQATRRLAIDIPSGLDCDTGEPAPTTFRADVTCTFASNKIGFLLPAAKPYLGDVHVVSIGTPPSLIDDVR